MYTFSLYIYVYIWLSSTLMIFDVGTCIYVYIYIYNGMSGIPWYIMCLCLCFHCLLLYPKRRLGWNVGLRWFGSWMVITATRKFQSWGRSRYSCYRHWSTRSLVLAIFHLSARLHDSGWLVRLVVSIARLGVDVDEFPIIRWGAVGNSSKARFTQLFNLPATICVNCLAGIKILKYYRGRSLDLSFFLGGRSTFLSQWSFNHLNQRWRSCGGWGWIGVGGMANQALQGRRMLMSSCVILNDGIIIIFMLAFVPHLYLIYDS